MEDVELLPGFCGWIVYCAFLRHCLSLEKWREMYNCSWILRVSMIWLCGLVQVHMWSGGWGTSNEVCMSQDVQAACSGFTYCMEVGVGCTLPPAWQRFVIKKQTNLPFNCCFIKLVIDVNSQYISWNGKFALCIATRRIHMQLSFSKLLLPVYVNKLLYWAVKITLIDHLQ